jgi:hypothetical protein
MMYWINGHSTFELQRFAPKNKHFQSQLYWFVCLPENHFHGFIRSKYERDGDATVQNITEADWLGIASSTMSRRLAQELGRSFFYLRWIPNSPATGCRWQWIAGMNRIFDRISDHSATGKTKQISLNWNQRRFPVLIFRFMGCNAVLIRRWSREPDRP